MTRLGAALSVLALLTGGCAGPASARGSTVFVSDEVPWSFPVPPGWHVSTARSWPDPELKAGVLSTHVTNVGYDFDDASPGPNGGGGASEELGPSAVVVEVLLLWYPADEAIAWNPTESTTTARGPTEWHDDAQNPGWVFERRVCLADRCVWAVEWHGPDASRDTVDLIEEIAQSVQLASGWTDPAAEPRRGRG